LRRSLEQGDVPIQSHDFFPEGRVDEEGIGEIAYIADSVDSEISSSRWGISLLVDNTVDVLVDASHALYDSMDGLPDLVVLAIPEKLVETWMLVSYRCLIFRWCSVVWRPQKQGRIRVLLGRVVLPILHPFHEFGITGPQL
jgi:hypothetical protein